MSALAPGQAKACGACGVQMIGALTKNGRVAPIEVEPDERGNVLLFKAPANGYAEPVLQCRTFGDGMALMELREEGVPCRWNHFGRCPEAERFAGGPKP